MAVLPLTASPGAMSGRPRLAPGPAGAGQARARVRAAVRDWRLPASEGLAVLLTGDPVTSVTTEGPGGVNGTEGPAGPEVTPAASGTAVGGIALLAPGERTPLLRGGRRLAAGNTSAD